MLLHWETMAAGYDNTSNLVLAQRQAQRRKSNGWSWPVTARRMQAAEAPHTVLAWAEQRKQTGAWIGSAVGRLASSDSTRSGGSTRRSRGTAQWARAAAFTHMFLHTVAGDNVATAAPNPIQPVPFNGDWPRGRESTLRRRQPVSRPSRPCRPCRPCRPRRRQRDWCLAATAGPAIGAAVGCGSCILLA
jgi:hypothetical protein